MLDRLHAKHAQEEDERVKRAEHYPDEHLHSEHSMPSYWRCAKCNNLHAMALEQQTRSLTCTNCNHTSIINNRTKPTDPQSIIWHDKPVL